MAVQSPPTVTGRLRAWTRALHDDPTEPNGTAVTRFVDDVDRVQAKLIDALNVCAMLQQDVRAAQRDLWWALIVAFMMGALVSFAALGWLVALS